MHRDQLITMSHKELNRQSVMERIQEKRLTQVKAAQMLNMSLRQIQRLLVTYAEATLKLSRSAFLAKVTNALISVSLYC